jgi:hypothetical protein
MRVPIHLIDIDQGIWWLDPEALLSHPLPPEVGLAIPVVPYGRAMLQGVWCRFEAATGITTVTDGAAALEGLADHLVTARSLNGEESLRDHQWT